MWCVPKLTDEYINAMKDIFKFYEKDYQESKPVVCLDEKIVEVI